MTIRRMRISCWIPKAMNTHSEYVILTAFLLQQWFQERASLLRYTYIVSVVKPRILLGILRLYDFIVINYFTMKLTDALIPKFISGAKLYMF